MYLKIGCYSEFFIIIVTFILNTFSFSNFVLIIIIELGLKKTHLDIACIPPRDVYISVFKIIDNLPQSLMGLVIFIPKKNIFVGENNKKYSHLKILTWTWMLKVRNFVESL